MSDLIIPDSRFEMPSLFYPGRKPVGNVKIDWSHPLARGLVGFHLMDGRNLAKETSSRLPSGSTTYTVDGIAFDPLGTYFTPDSQELAKTTAFTATVRVIGLVGTSDHNPIIGAGDRGWLIKGTKSNKLEFFTYNSTWNAFSVPYVSGSNPYLSMSSDGVTTRGYINGLEVGAIASGLFENVGDYPVEIGRNSEIVSRDGSAVTSLVILHTRDLAPQEIASLHANPYQFIIPA